MDIIIDRLACKLMLDVLYDSTINKIPVVFFTQDDIRNLIIQQQLNLTDFSNIAIARIDTDRPYSVENVRLEIKLPGEI